MAVVLDAEMASRHTCLASSIDHPVGAFTVVEAMSVGNTSVNNVVACTTTTGRKNTKTQPPSLILPLIQVENSRVRPALFLEGGAILPHMAATVSARQVPLAWRKRPAVRK